MVHVHATQLIFSWNMYLCLSTYIWLCTLSTCTCCKSLSLDCTPCKLEIAGSNPTQGSSPSFFETGDYFECFHLHCLHVYTGDKCTSPLQVWVCLQLQPGTSSHPERTEPHRAGQGHTLVGGLMTGSPHNWGHMRGKIWRGGERGGPA